MVGGGGDLEWLSLSIETSRAFRFVETSKPVPYIPTHSDEASPLGPIWLYPLTSPNPMAQVGGKRSSWADSISPA